MCIIYIYIYTYIYTYVYICTYVHTHMNNIIHYRTTIPKAVDPRSIIRAWVRGPRMKILGIALPMLV